VAYPVDQQHKLLENCTAYSLSNMRVKTADSRQQAGCTCCRHVCTTVVVPHPSAQVAAVQCCCASASNLNSTNHCRGICNVYVP
jgi:hypothetical protein